MSVVVRGGTVRVGDTIKISLPAEPYQPMQKV
jgi:MOSC domain-containing protein YiiM